MSLLNKNNAFNVRDYLFAALGLLCVFWFFLSYPSQEPRSIINTRMDKNAATVKAVEIFNSLGFSSREVNPIATLESNSRLLDSLQADMGRQKVIERLADSAAANLFPFYWNIRLLNAGRDDSGEREGENDDEETILHLDEQGRLIAFDNAPNLLPHRRVNREAIIAAFEADPTLELWKSLPDSAWNRVLRFDLDNGYGEGGATDTAAAQSEERSHTFSRSNIKNLANYHLKNSGWAPQQLALSDIRIETIRSQSAAEVVFTNREPVLGQDVRVVLTLLPTGVLLNLDATYNPDGSSDGFPPTMGFARFALVFLFAFATVILFYFRIRARAVDTTPALVIGVLAGLIVPVVIFLQKWATTPLFSGETYTNELLSTALQMGFSGALTAIGFFAVFAVGDSLMRQYWPDKLYCYDYLRQGMFFNKPIGETILRSVTLAFILCGLWSTALFLFPDLYFHVERTFLHHQAAWAPIFLFVDSAWFSLILVVGIFAVVATQVYGYYKNKWYGIAVAIIALMIMTPLAESFGPPSLELAISAIIALPLTLVFMKWDLATTLFTHFLFILMIKVSCGWILPGSPDFYIFIIFCGFLLFNIIAGILFITTGEERHSLPGFVPEYVEELAQEERIKQELQIAREVQQSFLPVETPRFGYLDMAAVCKPAYETGGDYYDFVRLDEHRVAVAIGDVSGKGIQAAFYMTFIKGILHSLCREIASPAEVLKKTNRLFFDNAPRGTFISLVYGIMDVKEGTFNFARAGHNPILKMNARSGEVRELRPGGIGIGLTKGASFDNNIQEIKLSVSEDDLLALYTDGIVEALNEKHEFFGTRRLNKLLAKYRKQPAAEILRSLSKDLNGYMGEAKQHDDMTMLIMKLKKES